MNEGSQHVTLLMWLAAPPPVTGTSASDGPVPHSAHTVIKAESHSWGSLRPSAQVSHHSRESQYLSLRWTWLTGLVVIGIIRRSHSRGWCWWCGRTLFSWSFSWSLFVFSSVHSHLFPLSFFTVIFYHGCWVQLLFSSLFIFGIIKPPENSSGVWKRCWSKAPQLAGEGPSISSENRLAEGQSSKYVSGSSRGHDKVTSRLPQW